MRVDALLRHVLLVQVEVEFLIVILPPGELRIDEHFLDTPVRQQLGLQLLRPLIEFVVVVAVHPDAVGAGTLADVITEPLVLQSVDAPAAASQFQCLAYHIGFQCIGETAVPGFLLEINLHTGTPGAVDGSMKLPDFLEPAEVGLHTFHQSVHLLEGAAIGKVGVGIEHHLLITGEVTAFVHLLYEKPQAAAQRLVHNGFHRLLIGIRTEYLIVSSFPFSPSFQFVGQQKNGQTETQQQQQAYSPAPTAQKTDENRVAAGEINGETSENPSRPCFECLRQPRQDKTPFLPRNPPHQSYLLNHRRNKEQRHHQGNSQIDDHYRCKVLQVEPYPLVKEENDNKRTHRSEGCRQHRQEGLEITPMQNVVGHDNGAVYHQIQRDSDTRQRIKLHLKSEEVVEDKCHRYIYSQAGNYQKKIFQLTSNEPYKYKQDEYRQTGTEVNLVQFFPYVLGRIIAGMHFISDRKYLPNSFHLVHHGTVQLQLVGSFFRSNG